MVIATRRQSKYVQVIREYLLEVGHATNAELAVHLRSTYPAVSDTTVHRITARLLRDGECATGPIADDGAMRFDTNLLPHDHFECLHCGGLRDIIVSQSVRRELTQELGGCLVNGPLTIQGNCHKCITKEGTHGSTKHTH